MVRASRSGPPHHHGAAHAHGRYANRPWVRRMLGRYRARRARHRALRRGMGDGRRSAPAPAVQQLHAACRFDGQCDPAPACRIRAAPRTAGTRFRGGGSQPMKRARLGGSMSSHTPAPRAVVALVTAASLFLSQVPLGLHAQAPAAAAPATAAGDNDGGWPRDYVTTSGAQIRIFQPQISSWENQKKMVAFAAASYTAAKAGTKPSLGTLKLEADTSVAVSERLVNFQNLKLAETNFPNMPKEQLQELTSHIVDKAVPQGELVLGLDRVLASIDKSQIIPKNVEGVKADPPTIYYSTTTAALVNIDGEPIWSPIQGNDLKFAVNTNWDLLQLADTFYLRYEQSWFTAKSITGPWTAVTKLPEAFSKLPADENWKDVKAAVPGRALSASTTPKIFVSLQPAEMILLQGPPNYLSVSGTKLLWVSNTESDIFRLGKTGALYYLVAGRWFSAPDFTGPWKFATTSLHDDFKKIPLSHERSRVLASVPGMYQAN